MVFNVSMLNALAQVSSTFVLSWVHLNFSVKYINYSYKLIEVLLAQKKKGGLGRLKCTHRSMVGDPCFGITQMHLRKLYFPLLNLKTVIKTYSSMIVIYDSCLFTHIYLFYSLYLMLQIYIFSNICVVCQST